MVTSTICLGALAILGASSAAIGARRRRWRESVVGVAACVVVGCYLGVQHFSARAQHMADQGQPKLNLYPNTNAGNGLLVKDITVSSVTFTIVSVDVRKADLRLFWKRPDGSRFGSFNALSQYLQASRQELVFAANAGIFDPNMKPCGLHVEEGRERVPLNIGDGEGNFYMKPNGVFLLDEQGARIIESTRYGKTTAGVRLAAQSGPLLLIDGEVNPQFGVQSPNRRLRSGVGISSTHDAHFVISRQPVTFYELALLFRGRLGCRDALYLDGVISRFYLPGQRIEENAPDFAGILGVTVRR